MKERLKTGIKPLDKQLHGGIPPGAIVTCVTDSRTQGELLLHRLLANHKTVYISTIGNTETIESEFAKSPADPGNVTIEYASPDAHLQNTKSIIERLNSTQLTVIDIINDIEDGENVSRGGYQEFLNYMQNLQRRTAGIVFLHRYNTPGSGDFEHITNSMSDIIIELEEHIDGDNIVNYLHMPKCRGGTALDERMKVKLDGQLSIDTSRDIA